VKIPKAVANGMLAHTRGGYPYEVCGVFVGKPGSPARVVEAVPVVNREADLPRVRYQIAPEDLMTIQQDAGKRGLEILGYYHSHPDHPARPSETDRKVAAEGLSDGVYHVVVGVEKGERALPTAWVFRDATQAFEEEPFDVE
jgi:proteasome lid subunit RPN8/RPN11